MPHTKTGRSAPPLEGSKIYLRSLQETDFVFLERWLNDRGVTHYMFYGQRPLTLQQIRDQFGEQDKGRNDAVFIIVEKKNNTPIGFAGLYDIHLTARKAEFRILIGEQSVWGKGYGTEACELLTYYGFDRLNLNRIYLGVTAENEGAVKSYEKSGYVREGVLREDIYRNSRYYDSIRMSMLREEYYKKYYKKHQKDFGLK